MYHSPQLDELQPIQRVKVTDEIIRQLIRVVMRSLKPGDRLPSERELASRLGVGRSSLREAVNALVSLGLLEVRAGEGTFVKDCRAAPVSRALHYVLMLQSDKIWQILETRRVIEPEVAALAAVRATPEAVDHIADCYRRMEEFLHDAVAFAQADVDFHLAVAAASQNEVLFHMLQTIQGMLRSLLEQVLQGGDDAHDVIRWHLPILEAIRNRQPAAARQAMVQHLDRSTRTFAPYLETLPSTPDGGVDRLVGSDGKRKE